MLIRSARSTLVHTSKYQISSHSYTLRFKTWWVMQVGKGASQASPRGMRVEYDTTTHELSGILSKKAAEKMHETVQNQSPDVSLTKFSESRMWPGPQMEEVWLAERAQFINWRVDYVERELHWDDEGHLPESAIEKRRQKEQEEKEKMDEVQKRVLKEQEDEREVEFRTTLGADRIHQQFGTPGRSP